MQWDGEQFCHSIRAPDAEFPRWPLLMRLCQEQQEHTVGMPSTGASHNFFSLCCASASASDTSFMKSR